MTAAPSIANGRPNGQEAISDVQSLTRSYTNTSGQASHYDEYFDVPASGNGSEETFYRSAFQYDAHGRLAATRSTSGTWTIKEFDPLGRVLALYSRKSANFNLATDYKGEAVLVNEYDNGTAGDGNLTRTTLNPNGVGGLTPRVTRTWYDWRDRPVAVKQGDEGGSGEDESVNRQLIYTVYDNLGRPLQVRVYDGDTVTLSNTSEGLVSIPSNGQLRARTDNFYNSQGLLYKTVDYRVDPTNGTMIVPDHPVDTQFYHDRRGNVVMTAKRGGVAAKQNFDGAGQLRWTAIVDFGGLTESQARVLDSNQVLEQTLYRRDPNGNPIQITRRERYHDQTLTGELGSPTQGIKARISQQANYFDKLNRLTASVDFGAISDPSWGSPATPPSRGADALVTTYEYNHPNGWLTDIIDPKGIRTRKTYNKLGQLEAIQENYLDNNVAGNLGIPTDSANRTTKFTYDNAGRVETRTILLPNDGSQTTKWLYGSRVDSIESNDFLIGVLHPDPVTGAASEQYKEWFYHNYFGDVRRYADQNGTIHDLEYDVVGRQTADQIASLGQGVDGSVRRLETAYDSQGNAYQFTSKDAQGEVINQVRRAFNELGQLTSERQSHSGEAGTATPAVQYGYSDWIYGNRPLGMIYPDSYALNFDYSYDSLDVTIGRLSGVSEGSSPATVLESYQYLGLGTLVEKNRVPLGIGLSYILQGTEQPGPAGDIYTGFDRFGRVVDQQWLDNFGIVNDRYQYGYDPDGRVEFRNNLEELSLGELYSYDDLGRLLSSRRGTLDSDPQNSTGLIGDPTRSQSWDLDARGNWESITTDGSTEVRSHNNQNQVTLIGENVLAYDNAGNLITDEQGRTFVYDAWNRLVRVNDANENIIAEYTYDALGRRITETKQGVTTHFYHDDAGRVILETADDPQSMLDGYRYVYSPVDGTLILRDQYYDGAFAERLWVQQDAAGNITALVDANGDVVERFIYDRYGAVTVLNEDWSAKQSGSNYNWKHFFGEARFDAQTGLYLLGSSDYSPSLGRSIERAETPTPPQIPAQPVPVPPTPFFDPALAKRAGPLREQRAQVEIRDSTLLEDLAEGLPEYETPWFARPAVDAARYLFAPIEGSPEGLDGVVPFYGSQMEADASWAQGKYIRAAFWELMTIGDVFLAKSLVVGTGKLAIRAIPTAARASGRVLGLAPRAIDATSKAVTGYRPIGGTAHALLDGTRFESAMQRMGNWLNLKVCFSGRTKLLARGKWGKGFKRIDEITLDDEVASRNEFDPNGPVEWKRVEELFVRSGFLLHVHIQGQVIETTSEHPFYEYNKGWVDAARLEPGDRVATLDGQWATVDEVYDSGEFETVYNLRVADFHTYFAGDEHWNFAVWAHNTCAGYHHFVPRFMGSTIGYGNKILTTHFNAASHTAIHDAMYTFLSARGMNWWKGQTWNVANFGRTERLKALVDFYKSYNGGVHLNDFIIELRATVRAGRLL